jgi:hypothetical protein
MMYHSYELTNEQQPYHRYQPDEYLPTEHANSHKMTGFTAPHQLLYLAATAYVLTEHYTLPT